MRYADNTTMRRTVLRSVGFCFAVAALCYTAAEFITANVTVAQESDQDRCLGVINQSRGQTRSIASRQEFFRHRETFCREYHNSKAERRSASFGTSYNVLSLSSSSSRMSTEAVATKYCRDGETTERGEEDYENYTSQIPGEAFRAYEACLRSAKGGVIFDHDGSVFTHRDLLFGVRFKARTEGEQAEVRWSAVPEEGTTCDWIHRGQGVEDSGSVIVMQDSSQANLHCRRENWNSKSAVTIDRANGDARMAFHWPAYAEANGRHYPVDVLNDMKVEIADLQQELGQLRADAVRIESGVLSLPDDKQVLNKKGNYVTRGIRRRIEFTKKFSSKPTVVVNLSRLDIDQRSNIRIRVRVLPTEVDESGFSYDFFTWADTKIYEAMGTWIAYGN